MSAERAKITGYAAKYPDRSSGVDDRNMSAPLNPEGPRLFMPDDQDHRNTFLRLAGTLPWLKESDRAMLESFVVMVVEVERYGAAGKPVPTKIISEMRMHMAELGAAPGRRRNMPPPVRGPLMEVQTDEGTGEDTGEPAPPAGEERGSRFTRARVSSDKVRH